MFKKAFDCMNLTERQYIMKFALPLLFMGLFFPLAMFLLVPTLISGVFTYILLMVPVLFIGLVFFYPLSILGAKKSQIDLNMHYYITHMSVLAASNMQRKEVIRQLSMHPAYGYLSTETGKIFSLMNDWNFILVQACRFISKRTPSEIFAAFLDRLCHLSKAGGAFAP